MDHAVKAEERAVRSLKKAVENYAEQMRQAVQESRREMTAATRKAQEAVEQRRARLNRAQQEVQRARNEMARAPEERRAQLRQPVAQTEQKAAQMQQELDRARKAEQMTAAAASDLTKILQVVDSTTAEHSSAAASILANLEGKLAEITGGGPGRTVRRVLTTAAMAAEMAVATMDVSKLAGNVSQGRLPTADRFTSTSQMTDAQTERAQQYYKEADLQERERRSSDEDETLA